MPAPASNPDLHREQFARRYDWLMGPVERFGLSRLRRELVAEMTGKVLEIGAGTGLNLPHYRNADRVVATDPDPAMLRRALARAVRAGCPVECVLADAAVLPFADGSFDGAVATCCFCTIPDPEAAFRELARVLKPGAPLRLFEHVRSPVPWIGRLQDRLTPAWSRVAGGCHLNRETLRTAREAGFELQTLHASFAGVVLRCVLRKGTSIPGD